MTEPERKQLLRRFARWAQRAARVARAKYGVDLSVATCVAQAIRETGWEKHTAGANNYFGLKPGTLYTGARVVRETFEYIRGQRRTVRASFRAYRTPEDSFVDYARVISTRKPYRQARELLASGDMLDLVTWTDREGVTHVQPRWEAYTRSIAQWWATDPNYGDALIELIRKLGLRWWELPDRMKEKN